VDQAQDLAVDQAQDLDLDRGLPHLDLKAVPNLSPNHTPKRQEQDPLLALTLDLRLAQKLVPRVNPPKKLVPPLEPLLVVQLDQVQQARLPMVQACLVKPRLVLQLPRHPAKLLKPQPPLLVLL